MILAPLVDHRVSIRADPGRGSSLGSMKNRRARCEVLQPRALHQVLRVITELLILVKDVTRMGPQKFGELAAQGHIGGSRPLP